MTHYAISVILREDFSGPKYISRYFVMAIKKILNFATILLMVTSVRLQGEGDPLW